MTSVLLHSTTATTDAFAGLSSSGVTYSTATLEFKNVSQSSADFRVVDENNQVYESPVSVAGGSTGAIVPRSLTPGTSTMFYLERYEVDAWIRQTSTSSLDYVLVTNPTTNMSVATGSTSSKITWATPVASSNYTLTYVSGDVTKSVSSSTGEAFLTGLTQGNTYNLTLEVIEGENTKLLATSSFTTSSAAQMKVTGPFASYVGIDWSASVDGQGSNYRIVNRENLSDEILAESSTMTSATIEGLSPGTEYNIVLQREELGGNWSDQSEVIANTLSSSMSFSSVASKTIEVNWTELYDSAQFEVFYTESGGNPVGNGQTSEVSNVLRDLSPGTEYTINLIVYELGQPVGLSSLGLTTNKSSTGSMKIIILLIIIVLFIIAKKVFIN